MYSDYAETDLDQPTDFSLKYGEEAKESGYDSGQTELDDNRGAYNIEGMPTHGTQYSYFMTNLNEQEALANSETLLKDDTGAVCITGYESEEQDIIRRFFQMTLKKKMNALL